MEISTRSMELFKKVFGSNYKHKFLFDLPN